jgi:hypothetical protein
MRLGSEILKCGPAGGGGELYSLETQKVNDRGPFEVQPQPRKSSRTGASPDPPAPARCRQRGLAWPVQHERPPGAFRQRRPEETPERNGAAVTAVILWPADISRVLSGRPGRHVL